MAGLMREMPDFDRERCNGCGLCLSVCGHNGFLLDGKVIEINVEAECVVCKDCELVCPTGALTFPFEIVEGS
jgi:ferredoxin